MSRALRLGSIAAVALSVLLYLFVSCMSAPPNPYDPSNTKIYLTLESSSGQVSADTIMDSTITRRLSQRTKRAMPTP